MRKINAQLDDLMKKAAEDLRKENLAPLLADLRQKILECKKRENKAFEKLNSIIKASS